MAVDNLPELQVINFYDTHVTDAGLERLATAGKLRRIYAWRTKVTDAGIRKLTRQKPAWKLSKPKPFHTLPLCPPPR